MKLFPKFSVKLASVRAAVITLAVVTWQAVDLRDAFWVAGLAAVGYGLSQIYPPAAWIVCGAVIFWMGVRR